MSTNENGILMSPTIVLRSAWVFISSSIYFMELDASMSRVYVFRTVRSTGICALSQYEVNFILPDFWLKCTFSNFIVQSSDVTTLMVAHVHPCRRIYLS